MKRLAQLLALLSIVFSSLALVRPKPLLGPIAAILLAPLKLFAGALAALTALLGGLAAVLGLASGSRLGFLAGGTAAALSARYVRRVTATHGGAGRALSADCQGKAAREDPPPSETGTPRRHQVWHLPPRRAARWERDTVFWTVTPEDGHSPAQLLCDVWQPPRSVAPSGLAYIFFHGGGWHQFDKDSLTRPIFRHLAGQGHVVMDVAYRLYPAADLVDMVGDAKRAVAWMKANAGRYHVNPDRIVVAGGSAGGHLALLSAYTPGHPGLTPASLGNLDTTVRGVIALYPVVDLYSYIAYNDYSPRSLGPLELNSPSEVVSSLVGGMPGQVPERYDLLSPITHASPGVPPTLLLQAGHDRVVPLTPTRNLHRRLVAAGVPVTYIEYPATEHAFDLVLPWVSPAAQAVWRDIDRFLNQVLST